MPVDRTNGDKDIKVNLRIVSFILDTIRLEMRGENCQRRRQGFFGAKVGAYENLTVPKRP